LAQPYPKAQRLKPPPGWLDRIPRAVARATFKLRGRSALPALLAALPLLALAGCDLKEDADLDRGRQLFISKCGSCHALAEAGTGGTQGPDLDAAFAQARAEGMDQDTIEGVVEEQVLHPRQIVPDVPEISMPADIVTGDDLDDVAGYVANVAGVPGIKPPPLGSPQEIFVEKCGSCHTMKAAGTSGTIGPDLDESLPGQDAASIETSIVDPGAKLVPGYGNLMPDIFGEQIPEKDLKALVAYLLKSAGS
jgi:mono/diheme cytochrome c family protein